MWDSGIIDRTQLSFSEYAERLERRITPAQVLSWSVADPLVWIAESGKLRDGIYPANPSLSYPYMFQHGRTVDTRLSMAGVRLAAYLNEVLGD